MCLLYKILASNRRYSTVLHPIHVDFSRIEHQKYRGIVTFNFSPRNLTQVTSTMKPGQDSMFGFSSVKRITLREGLY